MIGAVDGCLNVGRPARRVRRGLGRRAGLAVVVAAVGLVGVAQAGWGATSSWTGVVGGNWSDATWSAGAPNGSTATAVFSDPFHWVNPSDATASLWPPYPAAYPAIMTLDSNVTLQALSIYSYTNMLFTSTGGQTLTLDGGGAGATVTTLDGVDGQGRHTIATGLVLKDNVTFQTNAANGAVWVTGVMSTASGTTNVTKAGPGTLLLGGANTFKGTISVTGGTLQIGGDGNLGDASNVLSLSGGSSTRLLSTGSYTLGASRTITLGTSGATLETSGSGTTVTVAGTNQLLGSGALTKAGAGTLSVTAGESYSGAVTVSGGKLSLSGSNGTLASATGFNLGTGGTLELASATGTNNNNRIGAVGVTLNGGTLSLITDGTTSEGFGALTPSTGFSTVSVTGNGTLTAGSLGTVGTTAGVNFTGTALGSTTKIILTGDTAGAMGRWATVGGADWGVYDTTNGVKAMVSGGTANDYATTLTASRHVKLASSNTTMSSTSIYSLVLGSGINAGTNTGQTLTLSQGAILKSGGSASTLSGTVAAASDLFVYTDSGSTLNVTAAVTASGGLVKNGAGTLSLSANNTGIGGNVTLNAGTLTVSNAGALNQRPVTVGSGTTFNVSGVNYSTGTAGTFTNNGLVMLSQGNSMTFTGTYSGSGELRGSETKSTIRDVPYSTLTGRGYWFADGRNDNTVTGPVTLSDTTNGWHLLGATGSGTVVTFNGSLNVCAGTAGGNAGAILAVGNGGKIVIGANAQINNNLYDLINAKPFRILGDGVGTATVEFADGFKADHCGYEGVYSDYVSGAGTGTWTNNGLSTIDIGDATVITNNSDNLPTVAKRAGTTGAPMTHHGLWWFDLGSSAKWIVQTHDQEYDGGISFSIPVEINAQTNIRNAGYYHDAAKVAWYHRVHNVTVRKTGPGTLSIDMTQSYVSGSVMQIEGGRVEYNTDPADSSLVTTPYQSPEVSGTTKYVIDNHLQVKAIASGASFSFGPRADGAVLYRTWQGDVSGGGLGIVATGKTWQTGGLSVSTGTGTVQVDGTGLANVVPTTVTVSQDTGTLAYTYASNASFSLASGTTLVKTGTGTLQISAGVTQSYAGSPVINVNAGALEVDSTTVTSTHTPTVNVNNGGTLQGVGTLPDAGTVAVASGGTVSPGNSTTTPSAITVGSLTLNGGAVLNVHFNSSATPKLDEVIISHSGGLSLSGTTTVNLTNLAGLAAGQYTLLDYAGTLTGSAGNLSLGTVTGDPGGLTYSFVNNTGNTSLDLLVSSGPANLTWKGSGTTSTWDINTTANWNSIATKYHEGDNVTFDDTGTASTVNIGTTVNPGSIMVNNPTKSYTFSGSGGFAGNFVLTKQGNGSLTIATSNTGFTGSVSLSAGTLQLNSATAVNSRPITMTGGTLNLRNDAAINYGSDITQSGTGTINFGTSAGNPGAGLIWQMGSLSVGAGASLTVTNNNAATGTGTGAGYVPNSSTLRVNNLSNSGTIYVGAYTGLSVSGTYSDAGPNTGNFYFTGRVDPPNPSNPTVGVNMNLGVSFLHSATLRGQFSQQSDAYMYPAMGANGASTVVTFQGTWKGDGGTTYNFMFLQNGGKVLFDAGATVDTVADSSGFARQIWCYADNNASNKLELAAGFVADQTVYPGSSAPASSVSSGSIRFEQGTITLVTNASQSLPIVTRWANVSGVPTPGPNGHIVFDRVGTYTWQVQGSPQTYTGMVQLNSSATIQTDTDLTIAGRTFKWDDYTATNGLYAKAVYATVTLTKTGAGMLNFTGDQTWNTGSVLQINKGGVSMTTDPGLNPTGSYGGRNLTINVGSASDGTKVGSLTLGTTAHLAALNVYNTSTATVTGTGRHVLVSGLTIGGGTNAWTGKVDLGANDLIIQVPQGQDVNAAYATLVNQLKSGAQGGVWTGTTGVTSSSAANSGYTMGLGAVPNAQLNGWGIGYTIFDGEPVDNNSILVKYTLMGDVNLDGTIDSLDYYFIDSAFNNNQIPENPVMTGYINGDFNYDGTIDSADYYFIDSNFNNLNPLPGAAGASPVPEPASVGLLALGALGLLRRRR